MIASLSNSPVQADAGLAVAVAVAGLGLGLDLGAGRAMPSPHPADGGAIVALSPEGLALAGQAQDPAALAPVDAAQPAGAAGLGCAVLLFYMLLMRELLARQYGS